MKVDGWCLTAALVCFAIGVHEMVKGEDFQATTSFILACVNGGFAFRKGAS